MRLRSSPTRSRLSVSAQLLLYLGIVVASACTSTAGDSPSARDAPVASSTTTAESLPPPPTTATSFEGTSTVVGADIAARMTSSWRPGCPVPLHRLRLLTFTHWGFDEQVHTGELVVAEEHADAVLSVFRRLFDAEFPLQSIRLIEDFGGDDDRSMAANNTSAFNCRSATGSSRWSEHAYGRAVDINPIQNPFVTAYGDVLPPGGTAFVDRTPAPGVITADGPVVAAFRDIGWVWGGTWATAKDYQHFSSTGR